MMRRMAVHFWPDLIVSSRTTSRTSRPMASSSASGPRMALLTLSVSALKRTPSCLIFGWSRNEAAVSAEPVKDTRSRGSRASSMPAGRPQTIFRAPGGRILASMTSLTISWVSQAVAEAGLATTGTPESRAAAAFSHRPHDGKLNALMNSASPWAGTRMCWVAKALSRARASGVPSAMRALADSLLPSLA